MTVLVLVVTLTIAISAFCSLLEAVLYSTRNSALEAARVSGKRRHLAERMSRMKRDIAVPTTSILVLNTVANTAGATVAGMFAAHVLGAGMVPVFTIGLTLGILYLAEIFPKTYGATHWRKLWPLIVWPLSVIETALYPLVRVTWWVSRRMQRGHTGPPITEDEIIGAISLGTEAGELSTGESRLLHAVFHFDELVSRQVMVPRREVVYFEADWSLARCIEEASYTKHTRYPVCRGSLEEVIGVAHIKDLLTWPQGEPFELKKALRPPQLVPESKPINRLLREMQRTRQHMAIVVDEHGTTTGIVTLENILEQIVGALQDEFDLEPPEFVTSSANEFLVRGNIPLARVNEKFGLELEAPNVDTLSGLIVQLLDRLPREGDTVEVDGVTAEVVEVREGCAERVRMVLSEPAGGEEGEPGGNDE